VDDIKIQLPEKLTKDLSGSPRIGDSVGWCDPGVCGWDTDYPRFAIRVNLRVLRGENVNVMPLFTKALG
jgi:hypothetical protein